MKGKTGNMTHAHTKAGGEATRSKASGGLGGKKHKDGKPIKAVHGGDANVIGHK